MVHHWLILFALLFVVRTGENFQDEITNWCATTGTIGPDCDQCVHKEGYSDSGVSVLPGCYYDLAPDYKFTFDLSKPKHENITAINWKYSPPASKPDVDVDFSIECVDDCFTDAKIEIFYKKQGKYVLLEYISEECWQGIKYKFSKANFTIENSTFFVWLSGFKSPISFAISFAQHPELDLFQLFMSTSSALRHFKNIDIEDSLIKSSLKNFQDQLVELFYSKFDKKQKESLAKFIIRTNEESDEEIINAAINLAESAKENPPNFDVLKIWQSLKDYGELLKLFTVK